MEEESSLYQALADRCQSLEVSHAELRKQLSELGEEKESKKEDDGGEAVMTPDSGWLHHPGCFTTRSRYRSVLESMGHAVHVCRASSGEIVYWNSRAENLYGWRDHEVLGKSIPELLVAEEHFASLKTIVERLRSGQSWSGQFPFKKKSGEIFMAIVTKSPLYEDGELVGIISVSSDAAVVNTGNSENLRSHRDQARLPRINLKKIQWHPRPPIAPVPQIASSVSNLASRLLSRKHGDEMCSAQPKFQDHCDQDARNAEDVKSENGLAVKVLAKLHIGRRGNFEKEDGVSQGARVAAVNNDRTHETNDPAGSRASTSYCRNISTNDKGEHLQKKKNTDFAAKIMDSNVHTSRRTMSSESCLVPLSTECNECFGLGRQGDPLLNLGCQEGANEMEPEAPNTEALQVDSEAQRQPDGKQFSSLGETTGSYGISSSKGENELNSVVDCEIQWEDLQLREEIGQGSYAVVYRATWYGSDVAVKVYFGNEYKEETLEAYKKEIDIMKKLRHPNVLLFMGAVYSPERLAIVTELMPRGSLFRTLHKNNQALDIRRRLRMALDVARGMNYLHCRNPPIVHRDLKSSNLLVDKNWTVKVGDFGLSKWKNATFLTGVSERGTPQWMAPEVLRNEPSNEKSDIFSFGVILWELMTVSIPWSNLNSLQVVGVVGFMDRRLELPENLDPKLASLINDCWQSNPEERPSFQDIIHRITSIVQRVATAPVSKTSSQP